MENQTGSACRMDGKNYNCVKNSGRKTLSYDISLKRPGEDNIKMDHKEVRRDIANFIYLT
jgi:hypothetical protein